MIYLEFLLEQQLLSFFSFFALCCSFCRQRYSLRLPRLGWPRPAHAAMATPGQNTVSKGTACSNSDVDQPKDWRKIDCLSNRWPLRIFEPMYMMEDEILLQNTSNLLASLLSFEEHFCCSLQCLKSAGWSHGVHTQHHPKPEEPEDRKEGGANPTQEWHYQSRFPKATQWLSWNFNHLK